MECVQVFQLFKWKKSGTSVFIKVWIVNVREKPENLCWFKKWNKDFILKVKPICDTDKRLLIAFQ